MTDKQKDILAEAICEFGFESQMDMCIEECAELIQAINKLKRSKFTIYGGKIPINATQKQTKSYFDLCSEVADVKIMIAQMEMMLNKEVIDISFDRKIERLANKIYK